MNNDYISIYFTIYVSVLFSIIAEAENIMLNEGSLLNLPRGLPTIEHIDELREKK